MNKDYGYPPTLTPMTQVQTLESTGAGHYYVGAPWGWDTDFMGGYPFQGQWANLPMKEGAWFFGDAFDAYTGKTIKRVRVSIGRASQGMQGLTGARRFSLRMHTHASMPADRPIMSSDTFEGELARGERRWFDVTDVFAQHMASSSWKGFGVRTEDTANEVYMAFMQSLVLEVTYEA